MTVYAFAPPRLTDASHRILRWSFAAIAIGAVVAGLIVSWPHQSTTWPQTVLIVIAVILASTFAYRISSIDRLFTFGFAAAILAVLGPTSIPVFTISAWTFGVFMGCWLRSRKFLPSTESALYSGVSAVALVAAWQWVDLSFSTLATEWPPLMTQLYETRAIQITVSVVAFYTTRTLLSYLRSALFTRLRPSEILLRISWPRLITMLVFEVVTAIGVTLLAFQLNTLVFQNATPFGRTVLILLVATAVFGISGRMEARTNRERLDSLVKATLQLPWPVNSPVYDQAAILARQALPHFEVYSCEVDSQTRRDHIFSIPIEGGGTPFRLVAVRRAGNPPFRLEDRQILDSIAQIANETVRSRREVRSLRRIANTDRLTGLLNYRAFQATLDDLSDRHHEDNFVALIFIDIDNFKSINDSYGHEAGNEILQTIAQRIQECIAEPNLVARVGGDEFVVLLQYLSSRADAEAVQQQLRDRVNRPVQMPGSVIPIRISQGIAYSTPGQQDLSALVELADRRMYASRGTLIDSRSPAEAPITGSDSAGISLALRDAIIKHRLQLVYQPIVDLEHDRVVALEALVRYTDPQHGLVSTDLLLSEAARFNLFGTLSEQVIESAASALTRIQTLFPELKSVHVNVALEQLLDPELQQRLRLIAEEQPELELVLEVNEQSLRHSSREIIERVSGFLERVPARLAIDDIGQAYTGLSSLRDYPFEIWKVDRDMVLHFENERSLPLAAGILSAANTLSARVVFEGVETGAQDAWLRTLGAKYAQGYLYGRPLSLDELLLRFETGGLAARL